MCDGDSKARDKIITRHVRLAIKMARDYFRKNPKSDFEELVSEGLLGLSVAADRYDPEKIGEIRFMTYASWWVRAHVGGRSMDSSSVAISGSRSSKYKKVYFGITRSMKARQFDYPLTSSQIDLVAQDCGTDPEDVVAFVTARNGDVPLDLESSDENTLGFQLADDRCATEDDLVRSIDSIKVLDCYQKAISSLPQIEQRIIELRGDHRDKQVSLDVVSEELGITRQTVAKTEKRAKAAIRRMVKSDMRYRQICANVQDEQ